MSTMSSARPRPPARRQDPRPRRLYVIWHCWQNNTAYDTERHNALQRVLSNQNKIDTVAA